MRTSVLVIAAALALAAFAAQAQTKREDASAVGDWMLPEGVGTVRISSCAGKAEYLCGTITWLKPRPPNAPAPKTKDGRPVSGARFSVGKTVLVDMRPTSPGKWGGGRFIIPGADREIKANMQLAPDGTLKVNGCVAILLCRAQVWKRVS